MRYWLIKSEAESYSIDDLKRDNKTAWTGVRNYAARNHMRDMKKGDLLLFYHSMGNPAEVVGIAKVVAEAHPDETQFEKKSDYFEPRATREKSVWECVDVGFVEKFKRPVSLNEIKAESSLKNMVLLTHGRLSVQPVTEQQFQTIKKMAR